MRITDGLSPASRLAGKAMVVVILAAATAATSSAAAATPDDCLTPVARDGHEPVCNPASAQSPWAGAHRGSYAQASSPFPGPGPGATVRHRHTAFAQASGQSGVPVFMAFSEPYRDGKPVLWASVVSAPENRGAFKLDPATGEVIDFLARPSGRATSGTSGAYNVLDRDNHLIVARGLGLEVFGDSEPGRRLSKIALLKSFELPAAARCRDDDRLIGITMLWDGTVAFASELGVVGVVPRQPQRMNAANVHTVSLNKDACRDGTARDQLEQVSNSISADEDGGVYVVTSKAQYKFRWDGKTFNQAWRAEYETSGVVGGARLGAGSGTTPTVMGTHRGDDKFVVITDGQPLMNLVLFWRDEIPKDWKPIGPGKDRRIACEVPVTYGDPNTKESITEQSVLVRGYASVVVNNDKSLGDVLSPLPTEARPFSELAAQFPANAQPGLERIDWDPRTRTCKSVWANRRVTLPNGVPGMSSETGLVYGIGVRSGVWGLEGIDFDTGHDRLWVPAGASPSENSFFAGTEVGPDGSVWTGTFQGISSYSSSAPAPAPAPTLECRDRAEPSARVSRARITRTQVSVSGSASDLACGKPAQVARVDVAVARLAAGRCRFLSAAGRLARPRSCGATRYLPARSGTRWSLRLAARLPRGRYLVRARATDRAGNRHATVRTLRVT
jgi:hypothetical protein